MEDKWIKQKEISVPYFPLRWTSGQNISKEIEGFTK